ncbi:MAG: hypothetical protein ACYTCU_11330 [Planctomycetota bacterium]|jgi:hypothetical protein
MTDPMDLDALEEQAFRSRYDNGLIDVFLGLFVLLFGLSISTEFGGLTAVWGAVCVSLYFPIQKSITEPRLGYAEFGPGRKAKMRQKHLLMSVALGVSMLGGVAALLMSGDDAATRETMQKLGPIPFGAMLALMVVIGTVLLSIRRGYLYAALIFGAIAGGHLAGVDLRPSMIASGSVVTVCGVVCLTRFLQKYPRPVGNGSHGEA